MMWVSIALGVFVVLFCFSILVYIKLLNHTDSLNKKIAIKDHQLRTKENKSRFGQSLSYEKEKLLSELYLLYIEGKLDRDTTKVFDQWKRRSVKNGPK